MTDSAGEITQEYEYDAFGVEKDADTADANPFRYCGEYFDAETGAYYLRARYYTPTLGRFTSEDPAQDGFNWYTYCAGNPILFIDPSGYQREAGWYTINGVYAYYEDPDASEFGIDSDTYKIIDDLGKRWMASSSSEERDKLHAIAEDARRLARENTPYMYGQDAVKELLLENALEASAFQKAMTSGSTGVAFALSGGGYFICSVSFLINKAYGEWDYKFQETWRVGSGSDQYLIFNNIDMNERQSDGSFPKNWTPWIYFEGLIIAADDVGNINLAFVGYKMNLPQYVYSNFATRDGKDAAMIDLGIALAQQW